MVILTDFWRMPMEFTSTDVKPNLITGVGHGHNRQPGKRKADYHKKKHDKVKMSKKSRRRNRT